MAWAAFQVKTLYSSTPQYLKIKDLLMGEAYKFKEEELYFPGDLEKDNPMGSYVFVQVKSIEDFSIMWQSLSKTKYISASDGYLEIPDEQMQRMLNFSVESEKLDKIDLYDIVKVNHGPYAKMFGVVLSKKRKNMYGVGFKLFTGTQFKDLPLGHLTKVKSLFEVWKFPVKEEI